MKAVLPFVMVVAIAATVVGCATSAANRPKTVTIEVAPDGAVMLDGQKVLLNQLPRKLKRKGATRETGIVVNIPEQAHYTTLKSVTETLATAGYARVMFAKPRHASADVIKK